MNSCNNKCISHPRMSTNNDCKYELNLNTFKIVVKAVSWKPPMHCWVQHLLSTSKQITLTRVTIMEY